MSMTSHPVNAKCESDSALDESDQSLAELLTLTKYVDSGGTIHYFNSAGEPHRTHGPAVLCPDGTEVWYRNGELHRTDGPAVAYADGYELWYLHDEMLCESECKKKIAKMSTTP